MAPNLSKNPIAIILIIFLLVSIFLIYFATRSASPTQTTAIKINGQEISLEIAKSTAQHSQGLSGRETLCPHCGMIFVFKKEGIYPFWMKDTLIPLDMIWLDSSGKIVSILTAEPEPDTPINQLKFYQNTKPARYVIELNAHRASELKLKTGDILDLPQF